MSKEFFSLTEAAHFAGVHRQRVRRMVDKIRLQKDHPQRSLIRPTSEEHKRFAEKGRRFEWTVAQALIEEEYELEIKENGSNTSSELKSDQDDTVVQPDVTDHVEQADVVGEGNQDDQMEATSSKTESEGLLAAKNETIQILTEQLTAKDEQITQLIENDKATKLLVASYQANELRGEGDSNQSNEFTLIRGKNNLARKILYFDPIHATKQMLKKITRQHAIDSSVEVKTQSQ